MERFAEDVVRVHGKVNLVFNNAGVSVTNTVEKLSYDDFEWLMNINFWGVVHGTKAFLPYLRSSTKPTSSTRRASSAWSRFRARAPTTHRSSRCVASPKRCGRNWPALTSVSAAFNPAA